MSIVHLLDVYNNIYISTYNWLNLWSLLLYIIEVHSIIFLSHAEELSIYRQEGGFFVHRKFWKGLFPLLSII